MKKFFTILLLVVFSKNAFCQTHEYGEYDVFSRDPFSSDTILAISMPICNYFTDCNAAYSVVYQADIRMIDTVFNTYTVDSIKLRLIKDGGQYIKLSYGIDNIIKIDTKKNDVLEGCISSDELLKIDSFLTWKIRNSKFYTSENCKNDMFKKGLRALFVEKIDNRKINDTIWDKLIIFSFDFNYDTPYAVQPNWFDQNLVGDSGLLCIEITNPDTIRTLFYLLDQDLLEECNKCISIDTRGKLILSYYTTPVREEKVFYLAPHRIYDPLYKKIYWWPEMLKEFFIGLNLMEN